MAAFAIDDIQPRATVEPETPDAFADAVRACASRGESIVFLGGGSRQSWGRIPRAIDVTIGTRRLSRILRYEPGDLTVSVEAGVTIADLNRELATRGQMLPIAGPSGASTIGGAIATNESGPLRHRYGSTRDQLIGIRVATTDGRLASAGGNVVKNVAGYDLGKLVAGSFGTLAGIVSATFKLAPVPASTETLAITFDDAGALGAAAAAIAASQLDTMCLEAEASLSHTGERPSLRLLVRFGGPAAVNAAQLDAAVRLASHGAVDTERTAEDKDRGLWDGRAAAVWSGTETIVRAAWLPARLAEVVSGVQTIARETGVDVHLAARAAMGSAALRLAGASDAIQAAVTRLRARPDVISHVVVARAPIDVKSRVDVWGDMGTTGAVLAALKHALDPAGVLNAGRGPI